mgnify:CR=1 FL=1
MIDWENAKKLILSYNISPVFDVTNKIYKEHDNGIYYFECDDESVTMKRLCLKNFINCVVERFPIKEIQAVCFWNDGLHVTFDSEKEWLKN